MKFENSMEYMAGARKVLVGGVNSPVRAFRSVGGTPVVFDEARGATLTDVDGNVYIDYVGSWGPMIVGHSHPAVTAALHEAVDKGTSFGACSPLEAELARRVAERIPSVEKVRFVNSGTEATMSAIRLARGYTGRSKVIKFAGAYHGHGDLFLIKAGSGSLTFGVPDSQGVTPGAAQDTLIADYNDMEQVRSLFAAHGEEIAAVIVEPVAGNMGVIPPAPKFLETLRLLCSRYESLLIFDEVMTGFRVARGGAQERFGVIPDLTTLGKIIGGGLPVGAVGGSAEIMDRFSPEGPIYQAGTLSGNPLAMAAGCATLDLLDEGLYAVVEERAAALEQGLTEAAAAASVPVCINRVGSMFTVFFTEGPVSNLAGAQQTDAERFGRFFHGMLDRGIYLPPSAFESWFVSAAHDEGLVVRTLNAAREVLGAL